MTRSQAWIDAIGTESTVIAATSEGDLAVPVPTCPGWDVQALIGHVGAVHRWAADLVMGTGLHRGYDGIAVPAGAGVIGWYVEGRDLLVRELSSRDPDTPARTFVGERTVSWWARRQAGELAVHRWDLQFALVSGRQDPIGTALAVDGIDEWLEVFANRFLAKGPGVDDALAGRTVHLHATDDDAAEWVIEIGAKSLFFERVHAKADVALRGSASDLLLALWHRRTLADLDVVGDRQVASDLLDLIHVT